MITFPGSPQDNTSVSVRAHTVREPLFLARMVRILWPRPIAIRCGRSGLTGAKWLKWLVILNKLMCGKRHWRLSGIGSLPTNAGARDAISLTQRQK